MAIRNTDRGATEKKCEGEECGLRWNGKSVRRIVVSVSPEEKTGKGLFHPVKILEVALEPGQ